MRAQMFFSLDQRVVLSLDKKNRSIYVLNKSTSEN